MVGSTRFGAELTHLKYNITALREEVTNLKAQIQMMNTKQAAMETSASGIKNMLDDYCIIDVNLAA